MVQEIEKEDGMAFEEKIIIMVVLLWSGLLLVGGYALGFMHGTAVQEQELIDQLMIRDLKLNACYDPSVAGMRYDGKSKIYVLVDSTNESQSINYLKYKGKYVANDPNDTDLHITKKYGDGGIA
jgi:hypothetical protein